MKINILSIAKKQDDIYEAIYKKYYKLISKYANVKDDILFNKKIALAQIRDKEISKRAYGEVFEIYLKDNYNIILNPNAILLDSFEFSKLLSDKMSINFFIGGAFGFDDTFINKGDKVISLGTLTMNYQIVKVVLLEQIYRGFTILANHPYHK